MSVVYFPCRGAWLGVVRLSCGFGPRPPPGVVIGTPSLSSAELLVCCKDVSRASCSLRGRARHGKGWYENTVRQALRTALKLRMPFLLPPLRRGRSLAQAVWLAASRRLTWLSLLRRLPSATWAGQAFRHPDLERLRPATRLRTRARDRAQRRLVFEEIFRENSWGDADSRSGMGSNLLYTETLRAELPRLLEEFRFRSMVDVPCGDFFWMRLMTLDLEYVGGDIVAQLVERNQRLYGGDGRRFAQMDIVCDRLPKVDLVFCRDCLVHLSYKDAFRALNNIKRSGSTYLLTTTFSDRQGNSDICTGDWRTLNFRLPPFDFAPPLRLIDERIPLEGFRDKSLGLWRIADLPKLRRT
jgi:hypothetical protein